MLGMTLAVETNTWNNTDAFRPAAQEQLHQDKDSFALFLLRNLKKKKTLMFLENKCHFSVYYGSYKQNLFI
jgi:hypothetical protein